MMGNAHDMFNPAEMTQAYPDDLSNDTRPMHILQAIQRAKTMTTDKPKWTQGPWFSEKPDRRGRYHITAMQGPLNVCPAIAHGGYDARLIAAAPELYDALARAEQKLSAYVGVCKGDKELTDTILPMTRAALAKARGETT